MSRARAGGGDSLSTLQGALDRVCRVCTHQPRSKGLADDSVHTESTTHSSLLPKRSGRARLCSASESLHILIGVAVGIGAGILADSLCAISVGDGSECTYLPEGGECEVRRKTWTERERSLNGAWTEPRDGWMGFPQEREHARVGRGGRVCDASVGGWCGCGPSVCTASIIWMN